MFSLSPADADLSHPDPAVRQTASDYSNRLADFAAEIGKPLISYHGQVTCIKPLADQQTEDALLIDAIRQVCILADGRGLRVVFDILNRYETDQFRSVAALGTRDA